MSVKICPLDTDKQTAFYNFSGVINDRRNFFFQISSFTGKGKLTQKLFQCFHEIGLLSDPLHLCAPVLKIDLQRHDRIAFFLTFCGKL